jgi:hypothetical protein
MELLHSPLSFLISKTRVTVSAKWFASKQCDMLCTVLPSMDGKTSRKALDAALILKFVAHIDESVAITFTFIICSQ